MGAQQSDEPKAKLPPPGRRGRKPIFPLPRFPLFSKLLGGIHPKCYLIGGSTGSGKTIFLLNLFMELVANCKRAKSIYFLLDGEPNTLTEPPNGRDAAPNTETIETLLKRIYAFALGISIEKIETADIDETEQLALQTFKEKLKQDYLDGKLDLLNVSSMEAIAKIIKTETAGSKKIAVFIDQPGGRGRGRQPLAHPTGAGKSMETYWKLVKDFRIPVFAAVGEDLALNPSQYRWDFFFLLAAAGRSKNNGEEVELEGRLFSKSPSPGEPADYRMRLDRGTLKIEELASAAPTALDMEAKMSFLEFLSGKIGSPLKKNAFKANVPQAKAKEMAVIDETDVEFFPNPDIEGVKKHRIAFRKFLSGSLLKNKG